MPEHDSIKAKGFVEFHPKIVNRMQRAILGIGDDSDESKDRGVLYFLEFRKLGHLKGNFPKNENFIS